MAIEEMETAAAVYREFAPTRALRPFVRAFFAYSLPPEARGRGRAITREVRFLPGTQNWSALYADSGVSLVFSRGGYGIDGMWTPQEERIHVIGPMTRGRASWRSDALMQVGAYLRPAHAGGLLRLQVREICESILPIEAPWTRSLEQELSDAADDTARVDVMERALLRIAVTASPRDLDLSAVARAIDLHGGRIRVEDLAVRAGVSRQYFARAFRETVGLSPKLYCRLSRFRAALAGAGRGIDGAALAADFGYADQSHMIAEFRQFSGQTPATLARPGAYHPFLHEATLSSPPAVAPGTP